MLRDSSEIFGNAELSAMKNHSVRVILNFIDINISGFRNYYFSIPNLSVDENAITYHITNYFNAMLIDDKDGFLPYNFSFIKNPPQLDSRKETDLGVVILNKSNPTYTIIEFEAKRLSNSSNNTEYVYGTRGGMERFKRKDHGAHLKTCGMFAYIQNENTSNWVTRINSWITDLAKNSVDLDWKNEKELLVHINSNEQVSKYTSVNTRIDKSTLEIYHYFIDLLG